MPLIGLEFIIDTSTPSSVPEQVDNVTIERGILINTLTWTAPVVDQNTSYAGVKIVRKEGSCPTSTSDGTTIYEGNATTYTDSGLVEGTTYYYRFFAYDSAKNYQTSMRYVSATAFTGYKWNRCQPYVLGSTQKYTKDEYAEYDYATGYCIQACKQIYVDSSGRLTYYSPDSYGIGYFDNIKTDQVPSYVGWFIQHGSIYYLITSSSVGSVSFVYNTGYYGIYVSNVQPATPGKGAKIDTVTSTDINAYPAAGYSGLYYYELISE